jgi:poly(3-hydroxybutyrate) depolymerase
MMLLQAKKEYKVKLGRLTYMTIFVLGVGVLTVAEARNQRPVAVINANPTEGEAPLTVFLDGTDSRDEDGTIEKYRWRFSHRNRAAGEQVVTTFTRPGTYRVRLMVIDDRGKRDTAQVVIRVQEPSPDNPPVDDEPPVYDEPSPPSGSIFEYPQDLPTVNGPCPRFVSGTVTFHPKNARSNTARLWVGNNSGHGPLIFYFHGTGMSPNDALWTLGRNNINAILAEGGVVLAPRGHGRYAWYIANGDTREDDLRLIDEMVACAIQQANIDVRRIHATGLSSGATLVSDMIHRRSNYLASASPKSGGFDPYNPIATNVEPDNRMSALIFHGGTDDQWGGYEFYQPQSEELADIIRDEGGFAVVCNHGRGHTEPTWDRDIVWQFFQDHPWNTSPSPYEGSLPGNFPSYCDIW